ncbi:hypothetical protein [Palleronia aestuarii]|uniref:hypothetical protein n=1 Tax=Palleronia aestuarii TaxID=568105 RepID=UPI0011B64C35|nr:hypothetical protein [Palleronia aestuarii]
MKLADFQGDYDELFSQIRWYDDDYLASTATSGVIGAGETVTGEIEIAGDEDWFRVEIDAGQLYTFELEEADESGTIYDPYLVLYDAFGDYLTEGYGALSYFADTTDTFFVSVGAYDGTGSYALTATAAPYTDDFGDDPSTTGEIAAGETVTGEIGVPYDQDWFRVEIEEGLLYEFGLEGVGENGEALLDPYLALYDPSGEFVIDGYEALSFLGDTTGTYFIAAESYGETGSYSLSLTAGPYVDDFGNEPSTAGEIAVGEMATGVIGVFYDEDWFRIDLVENETYAIDLRGQSSGSGTLPDPYLSLLDAEGSELAFNDDTNDLDSQIVFTPDASAIYYLAARELSSGTGTFELEVFVYEGDILIG